MGAVAALGVRAFVDGGGLTAGGFLAGFLDAAARGRATGVDFTGGAGTSLALPFALAGMRSG